MDYTIEFRFKTPDPTTNQVLWSSIQTTPYTRLWFGLGGGTLTFGVYYVSSTDLSLTTTGIGAATWYHVAISRDGSVWHLYLDGTLVDTVTYDFPDADFSEAMAIGSDAPGGGTTFYTGYIDEFRIHSGAALYTESTFTVPSSSLLCL